MKFYQLALSAIALCAPQLASASLTTSQLSSVFPGATNLTGGTRSLSDMVVTIVANSTHGLWHLNLTKASLEETGWMAVGLGSKMSNADYLVAYPMMSGSSGDWTLSHRLPGSGSHGDPRMASSGGSTKTFYTLVPGLSSSATGSPYTTVAWLRPLQTPSDYPTSSSVSNANVDPSTSLKLIYASASKSPDSTSETAEIVEHNNAFGSFSMDISQPINLAAAADPVGGSQQKSTGWTKRDKVLVAHAAIGSVAVVLFVPAGVLLARLGRSNSWFPLHRAIQILSVILLITAAIMGIIETQPGPHFSDSHQRLGIILLALFVIQPILGIVGHKTPGGSPLTSAHPSFSRPFPSITRSLHIVLGLAIVGIGYWQVASGFDEWESSSDQLTEVPTAVKAVFWVLLVIAVVIYVVGWVVQIVKGRKMRRENSTAVGSDTSLELMARRDKEMFSGGRT
ncbi:hypothetical protein JCM5353_004499 [Sporobolomyces roseus]